MNLNIFRINQILMILLSKKHLIKIKKKKNLVSKAQIIRKEDYEILKVIGNGYVGKVLLAKQKDKGQLLAIKSMKKLDIIKNRVKENIKQEKKILESIDFPFIIKYYNCFQDQEKIYFVFEFCNGGELFYHLQKKSRFNEDLVKFYAAEIYLTLQYLHSKKILYRDLKPENLILDKSGHLKLIDFGLSISDISEKNLANGFCGTMEYLPPELLLDQDYGFSFDWWGFGVLIYEMFHGYPPFSDNNRKTLFNKILHKRVEFGNVNMSPEAKDLIQKLLNKNIDKRIKPSDIKKSSLV